MNYLGAALFVVAIVVCQFLWRMTGISGAQATIFAIPPSLALGWWFWVYVQGLLDIDELQQAIEMRALAIGGGVAVWLATSASIFTDVLGTPDIPIFFIAPLIAVCYGAAKWRLQRIYR